MKKFCLFLFGISILLICNTCRKYEKLMMVSTGTSSEVSDNSAKVSGQIVDEGEGITQYGHYFSTTSGNTSAGTMVQSTNKSADGEYTTQLTGLTPDTKYYTKAYISDKEKTVYGKETSFTTLALLVPELSGSVIDNATPSVLEMTYNLTLANIIPATSAFTVLVNSTARAVNTVAVNGTKVQLTLASPVNSGDVVTVAYTKPASNQLQTPQGGQASSITAQNVTNNVLAAIPGYMSSVIENATPSVLEITYSLTLANIIPATSAFTVLVNSSARAVNTVVINGTEVQLTLASPVIFGDVVTVAYTTPASNQLQTLQGGQAVSITAQNVINNVLAAIPVYVGSVIENATPSVLEMTYSLTLANIIPATSAFTVMVNSSARAVNTVVINGTKAQLTLASQVNYGDVVTVAYTKPGLNQLQTAQGGQAASIAPQNVTNNVQGAVPAYVSSVIEDATPNLLEMTYSLTLANIVPATSAFTVLVNGSGDNISNVEISGTKVRLTLAIPIVYGDIITVSYTKPASNPLQTSSGGQAVSISNKSVINNTKAIPVVITSSIGNITITSANSGGEVINEGGSSITQKGVCWSVNPNPTIGNYHTEEGAGTGSFSSYLSGLSANTTYYLRAYATNSKGTGYGYQITFKTFTGTVKDIENNSYYTVTIGTQEWMAQNLKTTRFNDGTTIPLDGWLTPSTPAYCWYNNNEAEYKNRYGGLYNWYAILTEKLCPTGWHVPTDSEWITLIDYLGGTSIAGGKLKEVGTTNWLSPNTGATNETGFTALPVGYRSANATFDYNGMYSYFSSFGGYSGSATYAMLNNTGSDIALSLVQLSAGLSVRCIQDTEPVLPSVTTSAISEITSTTAKCGGNVTSDGGATVTSYGVCWSTAQNPTISGPKTTDGSGIGSFVSNLTGLTPETTYYVRAYATNSVGTVYGNQVSFDTPGPPVLITISISDITTTTASSGGTIIDDGGAAITSKGICWSPSPNPIITDNHTDDGTGSGAFSSYLTGLLTNTIYYARSYAINSVGVGYGNEFSFKTFTGTVKDIENNTYYTVTIGSQIWMAQNLKTTRLDDGTSIPLGTDTWGSTTTPSYCWYNNDETGFKNTYGALYNYYTVETGKICPTGWHAPSIDEWTIMANFLGGANIAGGMLKESGFNHWLSPNTGASNETGFTALPGGWRRNNLFEYVSTKGHWWTTTPVSGYYYYEVLHNTLSDLNNGFASKSQGLSVRCIKD